MDGGVRGRTARVELAARPEAAAGARRALQPLGAEFPAEIVERAQLLVSELISNSLVHAERHKDDSILLDVQVDPDAVHVEVTDQGPGFEPKISTPTMYQHSGWGLYIVDTVADRWGVRRHDSNVSVWFELDLPAA
jgi:anti-sigma regulatory factor (Ser/Thr protein kinase)